MSTFTYSGTSAADEIDLDFAANFSFAEQVLNGKEGDDQIYGSFGEEYFRYVTLNGDSGDDYITSYGQNNANLNGGAGDDTFVIPWAHEDVTISITGGPGNDSVYIGEYEDNSLQLLLSEQPPNLVVNDNSTSFTIDDNYFGGTLNVIVEHSVEFISFFDEFGNNSTYVTEDLAQGIVKKYPGSDARSTIDWWPPAPEPTPAPTPAPEPTPTPDLTSNIDSDSIVEVPIDKKWAKNLWKFSGKDDIINVHIDSEGSFKKKSRKVSISHQNFYESVFQEIEDATDLEIEFTDSNDADIIIHNTGKRGSASKRKGYFDVNGGKIGRKRLNDERRENLAAYILTCFGLNYFEKNDAHSSDDSLMSYYLSESGYDGLTSSDIAALQSLW